MHRNTVAGAALLSIAVGTAAHASNVTWFGYNAAPTPSGSGPLDSNANWPALNGSYTQNYGVAFTTGSAGGFKISWIDLDLNTSGQTSGSVTLKVALHNATNSTPYSAVAGSTAFATDTVTISMPTTSATQFAANLTAAQLANISQYAMSANTSYALVLYAPSVNIGIMRKTGLANGTTNNAYTTSNGFTALDTFRNNSANYQNNSNSYPALGISFGTTVSAVPGSGAIALTAVPGLLGFRRRRR